MMILDIVKEFIEEYVLVRYKPDKHVLPPRQTSKRTSGQETYVNMARHSIVRGQLWGPDMDIDEDKVNVDAAWRQDDVRNEFGQRQETLTEEDIEELKDRGLSIEKAAVIKPYWAKGFTREEISSVLSRAGGKKIKGYSLSTVAKICGALSSSTDRGVES